jgi:predicted amidohydrolase YtcJ
MSPERIERTKRLGILPVPNPPFMYHTGDAILSMLGRERTQAAFPFRRLWDAGIPLTFGSDALGWHPIDVLRDLGTAVSRRTMEGTLMGPEQALSLDEALRAATVHAAYAGFEEARRGTLEPGKQADVVVLGEDPYRFPPERFKELPVDVTIAAGQVVYAR